MRAPKITLLLLVALLGFAACGGSSPSDSPAEYTVTFNANNDTENTTQKVTEGGKATAPADPSKTGHGFGGWYTDNDTFLYPWNFETDTVTRDTNLYAKWNPNQYTVTFMNGETELGAFPWVNYGDTIADPTGLAPEGLTVVGYYKDADCIEVWDFNTPITADTTLYVKLEYTLPFVDTTLVWLYLADKAGTLDEPAALPMGIELGTMTEAESGWRQLLDAIAAEDKYVALDLSACTMSGTDFDPDSTIATGKDKIVSIALPNAATGTADGDSNNPTFKHFTVLASLSGKGLTSIGDWAFSDCTSLALESLPAGLKSIGNFAFWECTSLALKTLPEGLESIGVSTFLGCTSLALDSLPESLTSISPGAFIGCTNLAQISLPAGLESIGDWAFRDCTNLEEVTCNAVTPPTLEAALGGEDVFLDTHASLVIKVPAGSVPVYKEAAGWSRYTDKIIAITDE